MREYIVLDHLTHIRLQRFDSVLRSKRDSYMEAH